MTGRWRRVEAMRAERGAMAAAQWEFRVVAGGYEDDDSNSDEDGWDIGVVRQEPLQLDQMLQADKNEALRKAVFHGDVSLIEELLNSGVNIESSFHFGWTPLMFAASMAESAVVRLLLDRGANACFEIDKYTVLMAACTAHTSEEKVLKTVEVLLSRNADPNLTCRYLPDGRKLSRWKTASLSLLPLLECSGRQMTPLMYAARKGYPQVVALLVAHGAHINAQDDNGYSALIWAAQHGHKNVTLKLLELGADKNLQTKDEKTGAEIAKINKHSEIYSLLSLAANHLHGRSHGTIKEEAIYKLMTAAPDQGIGSYPTFSDTEVFLQGLGLEHIIGLFRERDTTLTQLLIMQKDELIRIGLTNPEDQQKLLDAINKLKVEETRIGDVSEVMKLELSGDEFLKFLKKLNEKCIKLTIPVQTVNKRFLNRSQKMVLQWTPTANCIEVCKDLVCTVEKLGEEVAKLQDLMEKHEQRNDPREVKLPEKAPTLEKRLVKMGAKTLLGFGFFFFITKVVVKKTLL